MFTFLKKITARARRPGSRVPEGTRVYAVGDVHGRADLLQRLHQRMVEDAQIDPMDENLVVYLGDYVDRGLQVREVLDTLLTGLPEGFQAVYLRGNHEEMMLRFLEDPRHLESWLSIGGQATLMNYRVGLNGNGSAGKRAEEFREALREALPEDHLFFLRLLQTNFTLGDYYFVHAGVHPGRSLGSQKTDDLLWIRDEFLSSSRDFGARIVHGHSIVDHPQVWPNRISLDTGAYATGVLSCVVLEADQIRFLR